MKVTRMKVTRIFTSLLLVAAILTAACTKQQVANRADDVSFYAGAFSLVVQERAPGLASKADKVSKDAGKLAAALRAGTANSLELAANLVGLVDEMEIDIFDVLPAGWQRTAVMVALAAIEEVLRDIANDLIAAADTYRHNPLFSSFVQQVEKSKAADTLRVFAKKPKLRCRDAKSGKFLKMEKCKTSPETTVVERVKK